MARNMSFSLTTKKIIARKKFVTRRLNWLNLKVGQVLTACVKCMGIRAGDKVHKLCQIRVVDVRRELIKAMTDDPEYGKREAALEGYPDWTGEQFVEMFCVHMRCSRLTEVTRIQFEYLEGFDNG